MMWVACALLLPVTAIAAGTSPAMLPGTSPGTPAAGVPQVLPSQLAGKTLSAVAYVPHSAGAPGGGELRRIMLQAYLATDGSAVVRQWLPARDSYSAPAQTAWSLTANRLCIDLAAGDGATGPLCAEVHIWGPRIAGIGTQPYAMLDGDLQPGNVIGRRSSVPPIKSRR
jgi:hypothetical protein